MSQPPSTRKARLTTSRLAEPDRPIYALAAKFQEYLFLPDPRPLYALLGTYAGNHLSGSALWLMLVGSSSCGGTEMLTPMLKLPGIHEMDEISGPAALLSGTPERDLARNATGGLLRTIGACGGVLIGDYTTTILSMPRETLAKMIGAFRRISDGRYSRDIGGEGGRSIGWEGKCAMYAKCTFAIDRHHGVNAELGDRWLYWRYDETTGFGQSRMAVLRDGVAWKEELQDAVAAYVDGLGIRDLYERKRRGGKVGEALEYGSMDWSFKGKYLARRQLESREWTRLVAVAMLGARCGSPVPRDAYTRQVSDVVNPTSPPRLAGWLAGMYLGMEVCGLDEEIRWDIVGKVGLDGMPGLRRAVVVGLRKAAAEQGGGEWVWQGDIEAGIKSSKTSIGRAVEDLELLGVVEKGMMGAIGVGGAIGNGQPRAGLRLTEWARELLRTGWGAGDGFGRQERLFT